VFSRVTPTLTSRSLTTSLPSGFSEPPLSLHWKCSCHSYWWGSGCCIHRTLFRPEVDLSPAFGIADCVLLTVLLPASITHLLTHFTSSFTDWFPTSTLAVP
jgi:hypothetical protein